MSVYLNNAATTWPKPPSVAEAVAGFIKDDGANLARGSASYRDIKSLDQVFSCRQKLAGMFGGYDNCDPSYVTLSSNVTEALNIVIKGFLKPGMRAVTSSMEHNSVIRPLRAMQAEGVRVDVLQCSMRGYLDPKALDMALEEGAEIAILTHCSNVSGSLQNLEAFAEICSVRNVPLVVDCAQTAGIIPIDASALKIAALCFTGHKGLLGPQGTGGIIWNPRFAERCGPLVEGGTGSKSHEEIQPDVLPDKFEAGTPNLPGFCGLLAAIEWIEKTEMKNIREKEEALGEHLENGLRSIKGLKIIGPAPGAPRIPVYSVVVEGKDNARLARDLSEIHGIETRPGLHCSPLAHRTLGTFPAGALRLSPGYFNTEDEIEAAIEALRKLSAD